MSITLNNFPDFRPYSNTQPFTVRDGATYLLQLEALKDWLLDYVIPHINTEIGDLSENWIEQTQALIDNWEAMSVALINQVTDIADGVSGNADAAEAAQLAAEAARDLAEQFASDAQNVQDASVTTILNDVESQLRLALDGLYASVGSVVAVESVLNGRLSDESLTEKTVEESATMHGFVYPDGAALGTLTYESLQAACDDAVGTGKTVVAAGALTTDQTLTVNSSADLSGLTYTYTGSGVAVQVGSRTGKLFRVDVRAPKVINGNKVGTGWATVEGSIGIDFVNTDTINAEVPHIQNFDIGMRVFGEDSGNAYCVFTVGHIHNNKVGILIDSTPSGWSNQNTFIGGRIGANSGEGSNVPGSYRVKIAKKSSNKANNNMFINTSIEGDTPEYHLVVDGSYNTFFGMRFESSTPKVLWQEFTKNNRLAWPYSGDSIVHTYENAYSRTNTILADQNNRFSADIVGQVPARFEHSYATEALIEGSLRGEDYTFRVEVEKLKLRRRNRTHDNFVFDYANMSIKAGNGDAEAAHELRVWGNNWRMNRGIIFDQEEGTPADIGGSSNVSRPRNIRAGGMIVPGAFTTSSRPENPEIGCIIRDNTLRKLIMYNGTVDGWTNLDGSPL